MNRNILGTWREAETLILPDDSPSGLRRRQGLCPVCQRGNSPQCFFLILAGVGIFQSHLHTRIHTQSGGF
jgi:hypothetical protein